MNSLMKNPYSLNMNDIFGRKFLENQYPTFSWGFEETEIKDSNDIITRNSSDGKERTIEFPLAGFQKEDVNLYEKDNKLVVIAKKNSGENYDHEYKKIMTYSLNQNEKEIKSVMYENGMLYVKVDLTYKDKKTDFGRKISIE